MRWVKASERQPQASDGDVCGGVVCRRWEVSAHGVSGWAMWESQPEYDDDLHPEDQWLEGAFTDGKPSPKGRGNHSVGPDYSTPGGSE